MIKKTLSMLALIGLHATTAQAIQVNFGDTIRAPYAFATLGATELEPVSFFMRLTSVDPLGGSDSLGLRFLDNALTPLTFTRFDANGAGQDTTVGITFNVADFLQGPPRVPQSGFLEVVGLAGSFDVQSVNLSAIERIQSLGVLRQSLVSDFEYVETLPAAIPLPTSLTVLLSGLFGAFAIGRWRRQSDTAYARVQDTT